MAYHLFYIVSVNILNMAYFWYTLLTSKERLRVIHSHKQPHVDYVSYLLQTKQTIYFAIYFYLNYASTGYLQKNNHNQRPLLLQ